MTNEIIRTQFPARYKNCITKTRIRTGTKIFYITIDNFRQGMGAKKGPSANFKPGKHGAARGTVNLYCRKLNMGNSSRTAEDNSNPEKMTPPKSLPDQEEPANDRGLCVNCAKREGCNLPRPDGGVWHCEEYC